MSSSKFSIFKKITSLLTNINIKEISTKDVFTRIRNENSFGSSESASGVGSEIKHTQTLIMELPKLFRRNGIKSILDIPCGDFNWMKKVDLLNIDYIGGDIVDELISENTEKYSSENKRFIPLNIIADVLPKMDLIFVRDCFVHLSNKDILNSITNIKKSGCKYLMTTTFKNSINCDIKTGGWRPLNLQRTPFNFPEPEYILTENYKADDGKYEDKSMGLWLVEKL